MFNPEMTASAINKMSERTLAAETMGSVASTALIDLSAQAAVGLDINGNHLRTVQEGYVIGTVRPIHIGRRTHVWEIRIEDERGRLVNISRLTMMIVQR